MLVPDREMIRKILEGPLPHGAGHIDPVRPHPRHQVVPDRLLPGNYRQGFCTRYRSLRISQGFLLSYRLKDRLHLRALLTLVCFLLLLRQHGVTCKEETRTVLQIRHRSCRTGPTSYE